MTYIYRIIPAHTRTIFIQVGLFSTGMRKHKLNIPEMLVGKNAGNFFYFPIKKIENESYEQYYSPFLNTYEEGRICLGSPHASLIENYTINDIVNVIYNSKWKMEMTATSFSRYIPQYHQETVQYETGYYYFLKEWEKTGNINLVRRSDVLLNLDLTQRR